MELKLTRQKLFVYLDHITTAKPIQFPQQVQWAFRELSSFDPGAIISAPARRHNP